jgi:predicted membrane protein
MNDTGLLTRIFVGFFLVLIGTGFLLDQLGLNFLGVNVFNFWPLIFFVIGIPMLVRRNIIGGLLFLSVGTAFLAANFFGYSIFAVIWPLIIIVVGFSIIFRPNRYKHLGGHSAKVTKDHVNESLVFWGMDQIIDSKSFEGGNIECVFGGFKLDLREATIKDGALLEVSCVFGGGELFLPRNVRVQLEGSSVMGGVTNNTLSGKDSDPLLRIKASAVFGGIDIKN